MYEYEREACTRVPRLVSAPYMTADNSVLWQPGREPSGCVSEAFVFFSSPFSIPPETWDSLLAGSAGDREARGRNIRMPQPLLHFESVSKTFAGQHPPAPLAAAGVIGLPAPGFFLSKSFDGPQACGP